MTEGQKIYSPVESSAAARMRVINLRVFLFMLISFPVGPLAREQKWIWDEW